MEFQKTVTLFAPGTADNITQRISNRQQWTVLNLVKIFYRNSPNEIDKSAAFQNAKLIRKISVDFNLDHFRATKGA